MSLPRLDHATHISDRLAELAVKVKVRSRASLTDANRILETVAARLFNALFGWELVNLNTEQANYPAADLGDRARRVAIQVTNEEGGDKITRTVDKAIEHKLGAAFDRLIVFFLLAKKPGLPKGFVQPAGGPVVETWDIADLLKRMQDMAEVEALARAARVLDEEMGKIREPAFERRFDISRIVKYAPAELIGREEESKLLNDAWAKVQSGDTKRPRVLTFVALGGEGKTSLVAKWAAELSREDWLGCDAAFAWSFYSQGTGDQRAASSDLFLKEALTFFGDETDKEFAASSAGPYEKGQRLARVIGKRHCLLILDGLEPLQYAPSWSMPGQLKDQGMSALLKSLATASGCLCIVTTRFSLPDLRAFWQTNAPEIRLSRISPNASVHLLKSLGVRGKANDFESLVEKVKGHALTLTLLGSFLQRAFHGDIRHHSCVKFEIADEKVDGGHALRTMARYEQWLLRDGGNEGLRQLAILRLIGLFDRPADARTLKVLRAEPNLTLTEPLAGLPEEDWEFALSGLEAARLITVNRDTGGCLVSLDAHPHLRAYFATQSKKYQPNAWSEAHRRLFHHLSEAAPDYTKPEWHFQMWQQRIARFLSSLEGRRFDRLKRKMQKLLVGYQKREHCRSLKARLLVLQYKTLMLEYALSPDCENLTPDALALSERRQKEIAGLVDSFELVSYQRADFELLHLAVMHGCQAGLHNEAYENVYCSRIVEMGTDYYERGARGLDSDLELLASFFDAPWRRLSPNLTEPQQTSVLARTASILREQGRLTESIEAVKAALQNDVVYERWNEAGSLAIELSQSLLIIGNIKEAEEAAKLALSYIDGRERSRYGFALSVYADVEHQAGHSENSRTRFEQSSEYRDRWLRNYPLLFSQHGFRYCNLLIDGAEREFWKTIFGYRRGSAKAGCETKQSNSSISIAKRTLQYVKRYAKSGLDVAQTDRSLEIALCQLTLGRAVLYKSLLAKSGHPKSCLSSQPLNQAVHSLVEAGNTPHIPLGLISRSSSRCFSGACIGAESAQSDLDEAWDIASRGPMRLHMADIHLYRARLFFREKDYPWADWDQWQTNKSGPPRPRTAADDLAAAEKLINECGYHRRDEELKDAKRAIFGVEGECATRNSPQIE